MTINDGQILGTTKIVDHGPPAQHWNLVVLGDGYRAAELNKYHNDVQNFVNVLQATAPFTRAWGMINVYRVDISSTESGADDPVACADGSVGSGDVKATYFDSTYCFGGTSRRRLYGNEQTAISTAQAQVPGAHLTMMIVNAPQYGGAGGPVTWFSTHAVSAQIGIHEMAHSFFKLGDEYGGAINNYNGSDPAQPNVTTDTNRATTKWRKLIQPATPLPTMSNPNCNQEDTRPSPVAGGTRGLFEGGKEANCGLYRPEYNCYMRTLGQPFCAVCQMHILTELARIGGAMFWDLAGNPNSNPNTDFLGTTDIQPLVVKTNGVERMRVIPDGKVGIGTTSPQYALHLKTGWGILGLDTQGVNQHSGIRLHENGAVKWHIWNDGSASGNRLNINSATGLGMQIAQDGTAGFGRDIRLEHPTGATIYGRARLHVHGEELLYVLNKAGAVIGKEWGGTGNLSVQGNVTVGGDVGIGVAGPSRGRLEIVEGGQRPALYARSGSTSPAVSAYSDNGNGINSGSEVGSGVVGSSQRNVGVLGASPYGLAGIMGTYGSGVALSKWWGASNMGVAGHSSSGAGIAGITTADVSAGVYGVVPEVTASFGMNYGVQGVATHARGIGVFGMNTVGGDAAYFEGRVGVKGAFSASNKSFKIDHPVDPANKYLYHASVESPDMLCLYSGNITTNARGNATIVLPPYFGALNRDFKYQLTVIGQAAQAMVEREIENDRFSIKTDKPNVKVSWQVTGIRQDPYAEVNRIPVEQDKADEDRGRYLHPAVYGLPEEKSIRVDRRLMKDPEAQEPKEMLETRDLS